MKFLTVIFFIFVGFWLLGLIGRLVLPWWIGKKQREFQQHFGGGAGSGGYRQGQQQQRKEEGEVTISSKTAQNEHHVNRDIGDYVEYEDMKGK